MKRTLPVGEVVDLCAGDRLSITCKCGAKRGTYVVYKVTEKTAVVRGGPYNSTYRIKRRDIYYPGSRAFGDHYRLTRARRAKEKANG